VGLSCGNTVAVRCSLPVFSSQSSSRGVADRISSSEELSSVPQLLSIKYIIILSIRYPLAAKRVKWHGLRTVRDKHGLDTLSVESGLCASSAEG